MKKKVVVSKDTVAGPFPEKMPRFRTPYTNNLIRERCNSKSEDLVKDATPSLSELVDKFNRGQRLSGVNYGINPNLVPKGLENCDEPDDVIPIRCHDIVDVEEYAQATNARKEHLKKKVDAGKKDNNSEGSEQVPS